MAWTCERLEETARAQLSEVKLIVVANREPYAPRSTEPGLRVFRPTSGVMAALDPVLRGCTGAWVAYASGDADQLAAAPRAEPVPQHANYAVRRVWLTPDEEDGYCYSFSCGTLWPLCHQAYRQPLFDPDSWSVYQAVNERFAATVLEEAGTEPAVVFVQDFHFALVPRLLKRARPDLLVVQFWHIPWPAPAAFRVCPWAEELLAGMLGNDLLAFQTSADCQHFLDAASQLLKARIDRDHCHVAWPERVTRVRPHPMSVDPAAARPFLDGWEDQVRRFRKQFGLGDRPFLLGVERLDYSKGIPERLRAMERLLETRPELRGQFHLVQVAAPCRTHLAEYRHLAYEVGRLTDALNRRFGGPGWAPVVYWPEAVGPETIYPLYRASAGCVVSSLHEGMNLVAKEFVATREDEQGVLVLSKFAGAAQELSDALPVNPFDIDGHATALHRALTMSADEQRQRMQVLRRQVIAHNVYHWAGKLLIETGQLLADSTNRLAGRPIEPKGVHPEPMRSHR